MRLIDADYYCAHVCLWFAQDCDKKICPIQTAPTIDPESLRPQGKWIRYHDADLGWDEYGVRCSNCNWKVECDDIKFSMPFCPKCGAKMKVRG